MRLVLIVLECDAAIVTSRFYCTYTVCHKLKFVKVMKASAGHAPTPTSKEGPGLLLMLLFFGTFDVHRRPQPLKRQ
jgi:hypothetical protein